MEGIIRIGIAVLETHIEDHTDRVKRNMNLGMQFLCRWPYVVAGWSEVLPLDEAKWQNGQDCLADLMDGIGF